MIGKFVILTPDTKVYHFNMFDDVIQWAEASITTDWNIFLAIRFADVPDEWLAKFEPAQIELIQDWREFVIVEVGAGAVACATQDEAMLYLASEWRVGLTILDPEPKASPRDLKIAKALFARAIRET